MINKMVESYLAMKIADAIDSHDARAAGRVADYLRMVCGMKYPEILAHVRTVRPAVTDAEWDSLMLEAEAADA